ncbi:Pumilio domain-containing protein [Neolecta irregularis DAH-3]|uniref:Pumilio domain-containing protein n=1 Tax=Neolecta irregularis (strain DAH-3) TaxID=1198029 RepID=A0A1U7LIG9_NEOID|nr:Pumilio domain-containing protein [Neolecta irregularis DAH-3]|eukprot:OLL22447.1 Pumilio domain-containing protein [Neolecta irregularis DAH-3]
MNSDRATSSIAPETSISASSQAHQPQIHQTPRKDLTPISAERDNGAGPPLNESRFVPVKSRARELQHQEGVFWSPQTTIDKNISSLSREISNLRVSDSSPDGSSRMSVSSRINRSRAGTLPSKFPSLSSGSSTPVTSARQTPLQTPIDGIAEESEQSTTGTRHRSGSLHLPGKQSYTANGPFGPQLFFANRYNDRSNLPSSPAQSNFSKDDEHTPMRLLNYLGIGETPTPPRAVLHNESTGAKVTFQEPAGIIAASTNQPRQISRFRSYSTSAKENYEDDYGYENNYHNNFNLAGGYGPSRMRSRTVGVLDSPPAQRKEYGMRSAVDGQAQSSDMQINGTPTQYGYEVQPAVISHIMASNHDIYNGDEFSDNTTPTRALWLGNIPASTTPSTLTVMFSAYGKIESARVLTHKNCGFINYMHLESAINARNQCQNREIFPGSGPIKIGYAKEPPAVQQSSAILAQYTADNDDENDDSGSVSAADMIPEVQKIVEQLGATGEEISDIIEMLRGERTYIKDIPPTVDPSPSRIFDAARLRDLRKRIDNESLMPHELDSIAHEMLPEVAELSSDYLGNTVVQKLFEKCEQSTKVQMLKEISPHLASIGIRMYFQYVLFFDHQDKNGTWAAQKILAVADDDEQIEMAVQGIQPFAPTLFLDQFGNYVVQCCLRFRTPWNNFIFQAMVDKLGEIASGRFGARATRACLESQDASKAQQYLLAAAITLNGVKLATNGNGALLLTWLLDTCTFSNRYRVLAPRLASHLVNLCTHKLASLTVLKVVNQKHEADAREVILNGLFSPEKSEDLEMILSDPSQGPSVIFKILTTPFLEGEWRKRIVSVVRTIAPTIKSQSSQQLRRLLEEVGLSIRGATARVQFEQNHRPYQSPPQVTAPRDFTPSSVNPAMFYGNQMAGPSRDMHEMNGNAPQQMFSSMQDPGQLAMLRAMQYQQMNGLNPYMQQQMSSYGGQNHQFAVQMSSNMNNPNPNAPTFQPMYSQSQHPIFASAPIHEQDRRQAR